MTTYRINVRTLNGTVISFKEVIFYEIDDEGFLMFKDSKNGKVKRFFPQNCEVEEE